MLNTRNITTIIEISEDRFDLFSEKIINFLGLSLSGNNPDIIIIKPQKKQSIGIEEVRNLRNWAFTKPFQSQKKLILIQSADLLTIPAQNAILKITEEPPVFTFIFLLTENHLNLTQTIISRADLKKIKSEQKKISPEVESFLNSDQIGKFKIIDKKSKQTNRQINKFIDSIILHLRNSGGLKKIDELLKLKSFLKQNVNKKLVLDNLVLTLDSS